MNKEQYYDDHIGPKLAALADDCKTHGLSLLAVCEWSPGEFGRTLSLRPRSGLGIRMADAAATANGHIDSLMVGISRHAEKHGHSSIFLSRLGIPTVPGHPPTIQNPNGIETELDTVIAQRDRLLDALNGLGSVINRDKDGSYFICEEAKGDIDNAAQVADDIMAEIRSSEVQESESPSIF